VIRVCTLCDRAWVPLEGEEAQWRCPTCKAGMEPLSRLVGGPRGEKRKPADEQA
jgi:hypothetical protein